MSTSGSKIGFGSDPFDFEALIKRIESCHEDLSQDELEFVLNVISHLSIEKETLSILKILFHKIKQKVEILDLQKAGEGENFHLKELAKKVDFLIHSRDADELADLFFEDPDSFAKKIDQLDDRALIVKAAKKCCERDKLKACERIKEFKLLGVKEKKEVAKACIDENFDEFIFFLENFEINDPQTDEGDSALKELILEYIEAFEDSTTVVPEVIQSLHIKSPRIRRHIAALCVKKSPRSFANYYFNFQFTEEELVDFIRKKILFFERIETVALFKSIERNSQSVWLKANLLKVFMKELPAVVLKFIKPFKLDQSEEGKKYFDEIINFATEHYGMLVYSRGASIFEDEDEVRQFESKCLKPHIFTKGEALREYILRVGFETDEERDAAIFRCAQAHPEEITHFIGTFDGLSSQQRLKLFEIYYEHSPSLAANNIIHFKIEDENARLKFAIDAFVISGRPHQFNEKSFQLKATKHVFNLVRAFLQINFPVPRNISEILLGKSEKFKKEKEDFIFYGATIAPVILLAALPLIEEDEKVIQDVADIVVLKIYNKPIQMFKDLTLSPRIKKRLVQRVYLVKFLNFALDDKEKSVFDVQVFPVILEQLKSSEGQPLKLFEEALSSSKGKKYLMERMVCLALMCIDSFGEYIKDTLVFNTVVKIIKYRNNSIALSLLTSLSFRLSEERLEHFKAAVSSPGRGGRQEVKQHVLLAMIILANWAEEASTAKTKKLLEEIHKTLNSTLIRKAFKDRLTNLEQMWLRTCINLDNAVHKNYTRKIEILEYLCKELDPEKPAEDLYKRLSNVLALISFQSRELLTAKFPEKISPTVFLSNCLVVRLRDDPYLDFKGVADLEDKYLRTLGQMRVVNAWKSLAVTFHSIRDVGLKEAYNKFIKTVLEGCSEIGPGNRYEDLGEDITPHIHQICQRDRAVWEKWKAIDSPTSIVVVTGLAEPEKLDKYLWRLIGEEVFDLEQIVDQFPKLVRHYEERASFEDLLREDDISDLEKKLLTLMDTLLPKKRLLSLLNEVIELIQDHGSSPFLTCLQNYYYLCCQSQKTLELDRFVSGNWQDLLLCGTEVSGSCQRVDGDPELVRGLIGYLIDGKIKLIVLKDKESGKIISRALLRLLWDESVENEDGSKGGPVLFLDKVYPKPCSVELAQAIEEEAISKAKNMGLRLYIGEKRKGCKKAEAKVHSFKGPAPYEYADNALIILESGFEHVGGVMDEGIYQIANPHLLLEAKA